MSDFTNLARDLTDLAGLTPKKAGQAVQQAAWRTRDEWKKLARGNPMGTQYTGSIDYTKHDYGAFGQGVYEAEIGPNLARFGGKTGKGGLTPGLGILDDPESTPVGVKPVRARRRAELFADKELTKGIEIALDQSLKAKGL